MKKIKWLLLIGIASCLATGNAFSASPALLKPGDILNINVQGEPELSGERVISQDGSINLPLVGSIGVAGMKTTDAAQLIKQHLSDGFLKNPVVSVAPSKSFSKKPTKVSKPVVDESIYSVIDDRPLLSDEDEQEEIVAEEEEVQTASEQTLVEIVDSVSGKGIPDAVLSIGNKVYQSNRLGQIIVNGLSGRVIAIADGYNSVHGTLGSLLQPGNAGSPACIKLNKQVNLQSMVCIVIDSKSKKPIRNAEIYLDAGKILTNNRGEFKIGGIQKEYGEITIKKRGYKDLKKIIDYKGPISTLTFEMTK